VPTSYTSMFERATGHPPFPYQERFATTAELPDLLEAPTGSGKTATAVLGWLWRRRYADEGVRHGTPRRLVFCLPMRTLVEQTVSACASWFERLGIDVPVHAMLGGAVDARWEEHPDRDLVIVGTQDQLLSRALNRGYGASRYRWPVHFGLLHEDALWILDEVQLFGVGLSTTAQLQAFRESFGTWFSSRSLWMSATLDPRMLRTVDLSRELVRQQLDDEDRRHPFLQARLAAAKQLSPAATPFDKDLARWSKALAAEVVAKHVAGTRTLVVLNRVDRAQALHAALGGRDLPTALVHSRFRPFERQRIQAAALAPDWHGVLVATQAIEAGVDVSSRTLFTEIAAWPSLVQRFGRCNRWAEHASASVFWLDLPDNDDAAAPYSVDDLGHARVLLTSHSDVGPASLALGHPERAEPLEPVVRRRDLLELFDTTPDLAGHDIDVSPFIRDAGTPDMQVAWRAWEGGPPPSDLPALHRDELCRVPIYDLRKLVAPTRRAWRWDPLERRWTSVVADRIVPGSMVLLHVESGGYDPDRGWTANRRDRPSVVPLDAAVPQDDDEADWLTVGCDHFVTLEQHAIDVAEELEALRAGLGGPLPWDELERAARWHDLGKVHTCFQDMLLSGLPDGDPRATQGPWAKSDGRSGRRNARRYFRHELASALPLLQQGGSDLEAYVVAAHHGKVRMAIRSRPGERGPKDDPGLRYALGVWEGDVLPGCRLGPGEAVPEITLSLAPMELGGQGWTERVHALLHRLGPFRLALLEALVRVADWRGTARHRSTVEAADV